MSSKAPSKNSGRSANNAALPRNSPYSKSNKKRKRVRRNRTRAGALVHVNISPCTRKYAMAVLDPFGTRFSNELPCIPDAQDIPSYKFSVLQRGTFSVGTAGFGYIIAAPQCFRTGTAIANVSTNTFAGTVATPGVTGAVDVPYDKFPFNVSLGFRTVSFAIRCRYSGTELNRGGTIYSVASRTNQGAPIQSQTLTAVGALATTTLHPVERKWVYSSWLPVNDVDNAYSDGTFPIQAALPGAAKLGLLVTGTAGNTFEFEIIGYYEAIPVGIQTPPMASKSESDLFGYSLVKDFVGSLASSQVGQKVLTNFMQYAGSSAAAAASSYVSGSRLEWRSASPIVMEL